MNSNSLLFFTERQTDRQRERETERERESPKSSPEGVSCKLSVPGRRTNLDIVGQGRIALA